MSRKYSHHFNCVYTYIWLFFRKCEELFIDDWCVLSVSLSHCISQFLDVYRKDQIHQNTRGWKAMNDVLTCYKFHLLCLANAFKCKTDNKTKTKTKYICDFILQSTTIKRKDKTIILHISKMNILQSAVSSCLDCFICDTLHSADSSTLCWRRILECGLCVQCVQDCDTANR